MKKTTILSVMAVLWPIASKDKRRKSKEKSIKLKAFVLLALLYLIMGQLQAQENRVIDTVKVQLWNLELNKPIFLVDTLIGASKGTFQFNIPKVAGNIYLKVSAVKNQKARNVIINPILLNGLDEVLINLNNKEVREVNGASKSVIVPPNFDDLNLKLQLDTIKYFQKTAYHKQICVLEEKLKAELATLKTNKALYGDEVYSALLLDRISLNNYYRLLASADVLKNANKSPLGIEDTKAALGLINNVYNASAADSLKVHNAQYRKMLLKAIELRVELANNGVKGSSRDSLILADIKHGFAGQRRAWLFAHYLSLSHARLSPGDVAALKEYFNASFAFLLPMEIVATVNQLGFQSKETFWFSLPQDKGKVFNLKNFLGKVMLIDFWYTGCSNCIEHKHKILAPLYARIGKDDVYRFLDVSIDKSTVNWKRSIASSAYTLPKAIHLYTEGMGSKHPLIEHYKVTSYPQTIVIDKNGNSYNVSYLSNDLEMLSGFLERLKNQ